MSGEGKRQQRQFSDKFKIWIVSLVLDGASITDVARQHDLTTNMIYRWRDDRRFNETLEAPSFLPVEVEPEKSASTPTSSSLALEIPIEIELGCDSRVRCWGAVSEEALHSVILVLRRAA